jgi:hypothetical protein
MRNRYLLLAAFLVLFPMSAQADFPATGVQGTGTITGTQLSPTINIATTGTITGKLMILDNVAGPTAAQSYGSWDIVNANITVLLPTAVAGMSICVRDTGTAHDIIVDVQTGDDMMILGAEDTNGDGVSNAGGASTGDYACFISATATHWMMTTRQGTWAAQ